MLPSPGLEHMLTLRSAGKSSLINSLLHFPGIAKTVCAGFLLPTVDLLLLTATPERPRLSVHFGRHRVPATQARAYRSHHH